MSTDKYATLENMRRHGGPGVFVYSPTTGEESSADAEDYFWLPEGESLTDERGGPMVLVRRVSTLVSAL